MKKISRAVLLGGSTDRVKRMKKLLIILFAANAYFAIGQGAILTTEGGLPVILSLDEIALAMPSGSGSVLFYGPNQKTVFIAEKPDAIAGLSCGQLLLLDIYDVGSNKTVCVGVSHIETIRKTSDNRAQIRMFGSRLPTMKTVDQWSDVVSAVATCSTGGGGGGSTAGADTVALTNYPLTGIGTWSDKITFADGNNQGEIWYWSGTAWQLAKVDTLISASGIGGYYVDDDDAISNGLAVLDAYKLACDNLYGLPGGVHKTVTVCIGFACGVLSELYFSDNEARANGLDYGNPYAVSQSNVYGAYVGFSRNVATGAPDSLVCTSTESSYVDDAAAITGGLVIGEYYITSSSNLYGYPQDFLRGVSNFTITAINPAVCCDANNTLPYADDKTDAAAEGVASGNFYQTSASNLFGVAEGFTTKL